MKRFNCVIASILVGAICTGCMFGSSKKLYTTETTNGTISESSTESNMSETPSVTTTEESSVATGSTTELVILDPTDQYPHPYQRQT